MRNRPATLFAAALLAASAAVGPARAFVDSDLEKLASTGSCVDCDLSGAMLTGKVKPESDLSGANLNDAFYQPEDLSGAKLCGTTMADGMSEDRDC